MSELLCPAGSFEIAKIALYSGADALYLATNNYGARAYAKNLTLEELDELLNIAHTLNKKVYVTVNTIIKENELDDCLNYVKRLYFMGVDGVICTDLAVASFIIHNCKGMEAHISTQSGVKDLEDVRFFESYGAKRCVLARENTFEEIKYIKQNSKMPLEVFIHGALCVSYSGGCLMSSLLSSRSGNRGRCSQNCRREYKLKQNDKIISNNLCLLSMKDLNTSSNIDKLLSINVDSLKIEGRMKNEAYVSLVTQSYRNKLDNPNYNPKSLDKVFHRSYTKGFVFNEDNGNIVNSEKINNIGEFIGTVKCQNKLTQIYTSKPLKKGDRIRFDSAESKYYSIDKIYNLKNKEIEAGIGDIYLNIPFRLEKNQKIYRMVDSDLNNIQIDNRYKIGIDLFLYLEANKPIEATIYFKDLVFNVSSKMILDNASNKPLSLETLNTQLEKLNDTPLYLNSLNAEFKDSVFMPISGINELRRLIVNEIYSYYKKERIYTSYENNQIIPYKNEKSLIAFCYTLEQYNACCDLGIKAYYKNYSPYVNSKYPEYDEILIGNYGGLHFYKGKNITCDYSFNVSNSNAIHELFINGASNVTYSYELSYQEIKDLALSYKDKYKEYPNCDLIIYGRQNLMTTKYCPIKHLGKCPSCKENKYSLIDDSGEFPLIHEGCITHILNGKPLNIIDELHLYYDYANRFRLQFTTESYDECVEIIKNAQYKLNHLDEKTDFFKKDSETRGYFKRPIL